MRESIIADTSSLIALEKIDLLPLLCKIYGEVVVTESVANEFGKPSRWLVNGSPLPQRRDMRHYPNAFPHDNKMD